MEHLPHTGTLFDPDPVDQPAPPRPRDGRRQELQRRRSAPARHIVYAASRHQGHLALRRLELHPPPPVVTELIILKMEKGRGLTVWVVGEWFLRPNARAVVDELARLHEEGARIRVWEW